MNIVQQYFQHGLDSGYVRLYKKIGDVKAKQVKVGTVIVTSSGEEITTKEGDWSVEDADGNYSVISNDSFRDSYIRTPGSKQKTSYSPVGKVYAFRYIGKAITFTTAWGEEIPCNTGDFLCSTSTDNVEDVYRVEKHSFSKSYELME